LSFGSLRLTMGGHMAETSTQEWTCEKGLAAAAPLPRALVPVMERFAGVLEQHTKALDRTDENVLREDSAYRDVIVQARESPRGRRRWPKE
jgi:hypothetical protein